MRQSLKCQKIYDPKNNYCFKVSLKAEYIKASKTFNLWLTRCKYDKIRMKWGIVETVTNPFLVKEHFPYMGKYVKWHDFSADGLSEKQIELVVHLAGNRDSKGLRKGQKTRKLGKNNKPLWEITEYPDIPDIQESDTKPKNLILSYHPRYEVGQGKRREFEKARIAAHDYTLTEAQLSLPPSKLTKLLKSRNPKLVEAFKKDILELGFSL